MDFKLSPAELPTPDTYKSATGDDNPRPGRYWKEARRMRTFGGEMRFPLLVELITGLMSIPSSNADSERGFSILWKIHTDQCPTLKQSTLISLMSIKINSEECCHDNNSDMSECIILLVLNLHHFAHMQNVCICSHYSNWCAECDFCVCIYATTVLHMCWMCFNWTCSLV